MGRSANRSKARKDIEGISKKRKRVYNVILIGFAISLFLLLEFGLRIFHYGNDLSLFQKSENYPGYYEINGDVNLRYFSKTINTSPTNDIFLIEKPDSCYRIFVFGGSTTRGFPYQAGTAFPRILYYQLQDAFPNRRIEVVNLSASAINSYSYIDMLGEVLRKKADAILVYGGHNEYYGALGVGSVEMGGNIRWIKKLRLRLCKLRTYQLVQGLIAKVSSLSKNNVAGEFTLMQRIAKEKEIIYESDMYQQGIDQFRSNISELVKRAERKGVPVILSELVSNVNDQAPFKSVSRGDIPPASSIYQKAVLLETHGETDEARALYYKAKDLDAIRFRAPEAFNSVVNTISKDNSLPLVPMKKYFEIESPDQIIGNELLLEHLHPSIDGSFIMANAFFETMKENNFIENEWDQSMIRPISDYRSNWGFTELDSLIGDLNIKYLKAGWPFKSEEIPNRFLETYRYKSHVDSMAFSYLTRDERHIEDDHIKLAAYYRQFGRPDKSYEEYYSLIKLHPYIADLYFDATRDLITMKRYQEALDLINSAPNLERNSHYYYMTATLQLKIQVTEKAIGDLEIALEMITSDEDPMKILAPLRYGYQVIGDKENEKRVIAMIQKVNPHFGAEKSNEKNTLAKSKVSYDDVIEKSKELIVATELENAEELLMSLNKVEETFQSAKLIGLVYILQKKSDLAYEYCMKAYQYDSTDFENSNNLFILCLEKGKMKTASKLLSEIQNMNVSSEKLKQLDDKFKKRMNELN
jgi:tetratricopeptide (TPR) repeat protein